MPVSVRNRVQPKRTISRSDLVKNRKLLSKKAKRPPYSKVSKVWEGDVGHSLVNFRRLHPTIGKYFPNSSLRGKRVVQMGAGNGVYMHFLAKEHGVLPTTVELNRRYVSRARREGIRANHVIQNAKRTRLKSNSQDVVICDHFLFAHYFSQSPRQDVLESREVLREAFRLLKPGGLMFIERASPNRDGGIYSSEVDRPYLDKENLEGFEILEHIEGLHDLPDSLARSGQSFGLMRADLHPMFDLVVLQKPKEGERKKFFTPLDMFK